MRAIVPKRGEVLLLLAIAGVGAVSLPLRPIAGAFAGVWRGGRLERLLPAVDGLAMLGDPGSAGTFAVRHRELGKPQRGRAERVVNEGRLLRAAGENQRARPVR